MNENGLVKGLTENPLEEDLMPLCSNAFGFCESKSFIFIRTTLECATVCVSKLVLLVIEGVGNLHPVRTAMKNSAPAKFPKKLTNKVLNRSMILHRR
jgi:hypothetical protein